MRELSYRLADGTDTKSFDKVKRSRGRYIEVLTEVKVPRVKGSKIREACLRMFGVVTPDTIKKTKLALA